MGSGPSTFKVDRARDIFSFKLAGLLQKALSAHLGLKASAGRLGGWAGPAGGQAPTLQQNSIQN